MAEETITNAFVHFQLNQTVTDAAVPGATYTGRRGLAGGSSGGVNFLYFEPALPEYIPGRSYTVFVPAHNNPDVPKNYPDATYHVVDGQYNNTGYGGSGTYRMDVVEETTAGIDDYIAYSSGLVFTLVEITAASRIEPVDYPFAIEPSSYVKRDLVDFAPRAGGGDVAYSNLDLYQIITQDSWHHGFGFTQFRDKFGHRITSDGVDTRHVGMAMMFTKYEVDAGGAAWTLGGMLSGVDFNGSTYFNLGVAGIWKRTTASVYSNVLVASTTDLISNGSYLVASISGGRMKTSSDGTTWVDAGVSGNPPNSFGKLEIHNGFMWGSELATSAKTLSGNLGALGWPLTLASGEGTIVVASGTRFKTEVVSGDVLKLGTTVTMKVQSVYSDTLLDGYALVAGTIPVNGAIAKVTPGPGYDCLHFWASSDSSDAEGGGVADIGSIAVGHGQYGIKAMASFNGALHIARPDGVWAIDDTVIPPIARRVLNFSDEQHSSNFSIFISWRGRLYFNIKNILYAYNGSALSNVTPPTYSLDYPPLQFGSFVGSTYRGSYLYVIAMSNDSSPVYHLLCFDGTGWFELLNLGSSTLSGICYSPLTNRLFIGLIGGNVWSVNFQSTSELPYASFGTTGNHYLNLSEFDFGFRRVKKSFAEIDVEVYNVASGRYAAVDYSADGGSWYRLGYTTQSGVTQLGISPTVEANKLDVRVDFQTNSAAQSVIMRNLTLKAMVRPDVLYGHQMMVIGGDHIQMLDGMEHSLSSEEQKNILEQMRDSKAPINFIDPFGISHTAYISTCTFRDIQRRPGERRSNWKAILNVVEVR